MKSTLSMAPIWAILIILSSNHSASAGIITSVSVGTQETVLFNPNNPASFMSDDGLGFSIISKASASGNIEVFPNGYHMLHFHLTASTSQEGELGPGGFAQAYVTLSDSFTVTLDAAGLLIEAINSNIDGLNMYQSVQLEGTVSKQGNGQATLMLRSDLDGGEFSETLDFPYELRVGVGVAEPDSTTYNVSSYLEATLTAKAGGEGPGSVNADFGSTISFGPIWFTDADGNYIPSRFLTVTNESGIEFEVLDGPPSVVAVPEPSSLLMMGLGLIATPFISHYLRRDRRRIA